MIRNILSCKNTKALKKVGSLEEIKKHLAALLPPSATLNAETYDELLPDVLWFASQQEKTFTNSRAEHIYYLLGHSNGKERKEKLHIDAEFYEDNGAKVARLWRNKIAHILRADVYLDEDTRRAYDKLNEMYKEMVQLDVDEPLPCAPPSTSGEEE